MSENTPIELDISKLPIYKERTFVPKDAVLTDAKVITELYQKLIDTTINSSDDLEKFLINRSELDAAVDQAGSVIYIRMTCQTDDPQRAEAHKKFIEAVMPILQVMSDKLDGKFLAAVKQYPLDEDRYKVYLRDVSSDVELFREENVELKTQDQLLSQEYQTISGTMTVDFNGEEKTMQEMTKLLEETDRSLRESAWRAISSRRLADVDKIEEVFDKMLSVRDTIAKNAGCDNYRDYKFKEWHRFDYTPDDCKNYHKAVEKTVVPVLKRIRERRANQMQLPILRPWDIAVDPKGRKPLRPFDTIEEYKNGISKIFGNIDADFKAQFDEMNECGLLDLASRKGKAPGGYQCTLAEARKPFVFTNAVGTNRDMETLLHEGGHAFHAFAGANDALLAYRHAPIEFCEVASMTMELFALPYVNVFYNDEDARRSKVKQLEGIVRTLASIAAIDSVQHWIYENTSHNGLQRAKQWSELYQRFTGHTEDWSGLEKEGLYQWHCIMHLFQCPLYYIEYGIAQLGALGLWMQFKDDKAAAIANYKKALALGGSKPLPELFEAAGLKFDFSEKTIAPLMEVVVKELGL